MSEDINQNRSHEAYTASYIGILDTYKEQIQDSAENKITLKDRFFDTIRFTMLVVLWLFVGVITFSFVLFGLMIFFNTEFTGLIAGAVVSVVSSFVTMVLSIFKLPQIVAEYLFNKEEDRNMNTIIENIQKYENTSAEQDIKRLEVIQSKELSSAVTTSAVNDGNDVLADSPRDIFSGEHGGSSSPSDIVEACSNNGSDNSEGPSGTQ